MLACQLRQAASALPLSSNAVLSLCHSFADVMPKGNAYMASVLVIGRDGIYGLIRHFGQAKIVHIRQCASARVYCLDQLQLLGMQAAGVRLLN